MLLMEERVDVIDQTKAGLSRGYRCFGRDWPSIELLSDIAELIVVSVKSVESTEPGSSVTTKLVYRLNLPSPSSAKGFGRISTETTTIGTDHTNTLHSSELEHLSNSLDILLPTRDVVS
jgi:hypothetical protein